LTPKNGFKNTGLWQLSLCGHDRSVVIDENGNACTLDAKNDINAQQKGNKTIIILPVGDHVLNNNLCVKFVTPFIFTEIQRKGIRLFNKSNGVSFMYWWFI